MFLISASNAIVLSKGGQTTSTITVLLNNNFSAAGICSHHQDNSKQLHENIVTT